MGSIGNTDLYDCSYKVTYDNIIVSSIVCYCFIIIIIILYNLICDCVSLLYYNVFTCYYCHYY